MRPLLHRRLQSSLQRSRHSFADHGHRREGPANLAPLGRGLLGPASPRLLGKNGRLQRDRAYRFKKRTLVFAREPPHGIAKRQPIDGFDVRHGFTDLLATGLHAPVVDDLRSSAGLVDQRSQELVHGYIVSGFFQGIDTGARALGPGLGWLAPLGAIAYALGNIGGVGAWLTGPARVAFAIGLDRYFPPAFGRIHPRWKTPYVAILVQAALATVFLFLSVLGKGTTVEKAYLIILDTQLLVYFIPYVYLFIAFLLHRRTEAPADTVRVHGGTAGAWAVGLSGLLVTRFAMVVAMVPPGGDTNPWLFEAKVIGGALGFVILGGVVYWRGR